MPDILKHLYNACNPTVPADEGYYLDSSQARGDSALVEEFRNRLVRADSTNFQRFLFTGHIGCGKSSELKALARALAGEELTEDERYLPIYVNASDYIDEYDVAPVDILLAALAELAATLRDSFGIELDGSLFQKRLVGFWDALSSEVTIEKADFSLGPLKAPIQLLKRDAEARHRVRAALEPRMATVLDVINEVLLNARLEIKNHLPFQDFVLILDNLERIRKIGQIDEGTPSHREIFLERYTQLTSLEAHVVFTVPLRLVRSQDGPQLAQRYSKPFVLPMVKVIRRDKSRYDEGLGFLRDILARRLGECSMDEAINADALEFLLSYSGGHMRTLMMSVQDASIYSESTPITIVAATRAVQQNVRMYSTSIPDIHWERLARLDLSKDQKIPNGDLEYLAMLENLSVMEYINGDADEFNFSGAEPWYAVNPSVRELQRFKAWRALLDVET